MCRRGENDLFPMITIESYNSTSNSRYIKFSEIFYHIENAAAIVLNNTLYRLGDENRFIGPYYAPHTLKLDFKNLTELQRISDFIVPQNPTVSELDGKMYVVRSASSGLVESYD